MSNLIRQAGFRARCTLLAVLLTAGASSAQVPAPAVPTCLPDGPFFQRAILFSGFGPDWFIYLGMYDAAVDAGYTPDVILASSGGAVAAAFIAAYPDRATRWAVLRSPELHQLVMGPHVERPQVFPLFARALGWTFRSLVYAHHPPDLFAPPVISFPTRTGLAELYGKFPTEAARPKVILVAALLDADFSKRAWTERKSFTEAWFTDSATGKLLAGRDSAIGQRFPNSFVRPCGIVPEEVSLFDALRASTAEPYMTAPALVNGRYYTGGGLNVWPVELAQSIARRVMVPRTSFFRGLYEVATHSSFGFCQQDRQEEVDAKPVDIQVDMTDKVQALRDVSFWPILRMVHSSTGGRANPDMEAVQETQYLVPRCRMVDNVPEDRAEFLRRVCAQWRYGYERGRAALCKTGNGTKRPVAP
jgi:hypothetical protein